MTGVPLIKFIDKNFLRITQCKVSAGTNEIYAIHSFGDRLSAHGDFVCYDHSRRRYNTNCIILFNSASILTQFL